MKNRIIVSFTSYPKRISSVIKVVQSIKNQMILPDKLVLYLASDQFKDMPLPKELYDSTNDWFEIRWCDEDLMSHKKYYYAFRDFPDDIIITIDDDFIYSDKMISELVHGYSLFDNCIIARRGSVIIWNEKCEVMPYEQWSDVPFDYLFKPRMDIFCTTGGGTLFPPGLFGDELFNKDYFMKECRYVDDIWLKINQIMCNIPVVMVRRFFFDELMEEYKGTGLYFEHNIDNGNDIPLNRALGWYGIDIADKCMYQDSLFSNDVQSIIKDDEIKVLQYALKQSHYKNISLYGAGKVAQKYYRYLENLGLLNEFKMFVVTNKGVTVDELFGIPVMEFKETVSMDLTYIIAVSFNKQKEIISFLHNNGISSDRIISIYDF